MHSMTSAAPSYVKPSIVDDLKWFYREHQPWLFAATAALLAVVFRADIAPMFVSGEWNLGALYSVIFDWSSIQSAFLFGVYAFILSRSEPVIKATHKTQAFREARTYVRRTAIIALVLTATTAPMLIDSVGISGAGLLDVGYWTVSAYVVFTVYVFGRFMKCLRVFRVLERGDG